MLKEEIVIQTAKERYLKCVSSWAEVKRKNTEIKKFISGDQWNYQTRAKFENSGFAAITSNRIPTFLSQITNEIRKNTPEININPRSDDTKTASIINDMIRNIQDESDADTAYTVGAENAAMTGLGYIRVLSKYASTDSMDQILSIEPIVDTNEVMFDPASKAIDGSDMEYAFINTTISADEYCRKYETSKYKRFLRGELDANELTSVGWSTGANNHRRRTKAPDVVVVMEYYFKDYEQKTLYQYRDIDTNEITINTEKLDSAYYEVLQSRQISVPIIRWCKMNELEILEETVVPGEYIPIAVVKGNEYWVEGERKIVGAVEPAMETQVQLNYALSFRAQLLQMSPKAPWIGTADQFKNYEQQWADINVSNQAFLPYNSDGNAPPPYRDTGELPINTANVMIAQAERDLVAIFGTFDPSNQTVAPESGKAILARQAQSYNSNFHFYDNLAKSIQHVGRILVQGIPVIYDTSRKIELLSEDKKRKTVLINTPDASGEIQHDLTKGKYGVSIQTGASFGTKRQETVASAMSLIQSYPAAAPAIADIIVRSMDWPGADKIADSLEALVPQNVLEARKTDPENAVAQIPALKAQLNALTEQNQALTLQVQQATTKLQESADKVMIEHLKADVDMKKIEQDSFVKSATLELDAKRLDMEYHIKTQELILAQEELELKKKGIAIEGTVAMHGIVNDIEDKSKVIIETPMLASIDESDDNITGLGSALK